MKSLIYEGKTVKESTQKESIQVLRPKKIFSRNLITYHQPKAPAAEAFRTLRTNLGFAGIDKALKTVVFTSPEPNDGKSTCAANFCIAMAKADKKILLIDCDLRKPKIHRYFGVGNDVGLTHILADMVFDDQPTEDIIKNVTEIEGLFLLTAGFTPPNPTEMLASQKFIQFLQRMQEQFDMVVIDTPPVAQLTDAAIVGRNVDGVLLVLASGETNIQAAISAKQALMNVQANILGVVLTKIDKKSGSYYNYHYYNNYTYGESEND